MAAAAAEAGTLSSAAQLECFCCSGWPESEAGVAWGAFWAFPANHRPLRCFVIDTSNVVSSAADPNAAAVDALLDLNARRPALQLRRQPRSNNAMCFWEQFLVCDEIPEGAGA